jgi:hypothetical protein
MDDEGTTGRHLEAVGIATGYQKSQTLAVVTIYPFLHLIRFVFVFIFPRVRPRFCTLNAVGIEHEIVLKAGRLTILVC